MLKAAKNYYYFLKEYAKSNVKVQNFTRAHFMEYTMGGKDYYSPFISSYVSGGLAAKSVTTENLTVIPSAANNSFGRTLTRSAQIYGFDPH